MMTDLGKSTYELVKEYGFGKYYNPYMGNVIIELTDVNNRILNRIALFLAENTDWVMGVEYADEEKIEGCIYVTQKENL